MADAVGLPEEYELGKCHAVVLVAFRKEEENGEPGSDGMRPGSSSTRQTKSHEQGGRPGTTGSASSLGHLSEGTQGMTLVAATGKRKTQLETAIRETIRSGALAQPTNGDEASKGQKKKGAGGGKKDSSGEGDGGSSSSKRLKQVPSIERLINLTWASRETKLRLLQYVDPDASAQDQSKGEGRRPSTGSGSKKGKSNNKKGAAEMAAESAEEQDSWKSVLSEWDVHAAVLYPGEKDQKLISDDAFPLFRMLTDKLTEKYNSSMCLFCLSTNEQLSDFMEQLYEIEAEALLHARSNRPGKQKKERATIDVHQLIDFLFPAHLQKPRSTGRLFLLAKYGPLNENGMLSGGYHKQRELTDSELTVLIKDIEEEDVLRVALGNNTYSAVSKKETLVELRAHQSSLPELSQDTIKAMCRKVRSSDGNVYFDELQEEINRQRQLRIKELRDQVSKGSSAKNQTMIQEPPPLLGRGALDTNTKQQMTSSDCFHVDTKLSNPARYRVTSGLSHKNSHKIAPIEGQNSAEVSINSRLLCRESTVQRVSTLRVNGRTKFGNFTFALVYPQKPVWNDAAILEQSGVASYIPNGRYSGK
eukprot:gb/GECG01011546.1/.p1 GENE.gb/GECG01011546.1/~~gb/GECG01011546.1/.p1  ORF type:complete len:588 (+),score=98.74 gb/GECG01011546.1/:1-1764(+)